MVYAAIVDKVFNVNDAIITDNVFYLGDKSLLKSSYIQRRLNNLNIVIFEKCDVDSVINYNPKDIQTLIDNENLSKLIYYCSYYDLWDTNIYEIGKKNITNFDLLPYKFPLDTPPKVYCWIVEHESKIFWDTYNGDNFDECFNKLSKIELLKSIIEIGRDFNKLSEMSQYFLVNPSYFENFYDNNKLHTLIKTPLHAKYLLTLYMKFIHVLNLNVVKDLFNFNYQDITPIMEKGKKLYTKNIKNNIAIPDYNFIEFNYRCFMGELYDVIKEICDGMFSDFLNKLIFNNHLINIIEVIYIDYKYKDNLYKTLIDKNYLVLHGVDSLSVFFCDNIICIQFINLRINDVNNHYHDFKNNDIIFEINFAVALITGNYLDKVDNNIHNFNIQNKLDKSYVEYVSNLEPANEKEIRYSQVINTIYNLRPPLISENLRFEYDFQYDGYLLKHTSEYNFNHPLNNCFINPKKILYYDDDNNIKKIDSLPLLLNINGNIILIDYTNELLLDIGPRPLVYKYNGQYHPYDLLKVRHLQYIVIKQNYLIVNNFNIDKEYKKLIDRVKNEEITEYMRKMDLTNVDIDYNFTSYDFDMYMNESVSDDDENNESDDDDDEDEENDELYSSD